VRGADRADRVDRDRALGSPGRHPSPAPPWPGVVPGATADGWATPEPPERVLVRLRPHGRVLVVPTVVLLVLVAVAGWAANGLRPDWARTAALVVVAVLALLSWLVPLLRWAGRRYVVTTRRVVVRTGLLVSTRREVAHDRVVDVVLRRGVLQALARSGDVHLVVGQGRPPLVLADVPAARLVQATLHELADRAAPEPPPPGHGPAGWPFPVG